MISEIYKYKNILQLAENLKKELRHSWLSNGRQESVAEHSWRLSLMVMMFASKLDQPVDVHKCLKMAVIHDLPEAITGDIPTLGDSDIHKDKYENECRAMSQIRDTLNNTLGKEWFDLWQEYEKRESYEAKFVNALDKLEVIIQHNEADIKTWTDVEKAANTTYAKRHCEFDSFLRSLSESVSEDVSNKLKIAMNHVE